MYVTLFPDVTVSPYFGASFIPADLKGVRLLQSDSAATVEDHSVGGAFSLGAVAEVANFNVFVQAEYDLLTFQTRNWVRPAGFPATSPPSEIDFTGLRWSAGIQLPIGSTK